MTLRYAHRSPAHLRSAVERLEGFTEPSPSTATPAPSDAVEVRV
jgi:hypothetical protein